MQKCLGAVRKNVAEGRDEKLMINFIGLVKFIINWIAFVQGGYTPLHNATTRGYLKAAKMLIKEKATVDIMDHVS